MKLYTSMLVLGFLCGCAGMQAPPPEPPNAAIHDNLIVPRVRIGEAALGMSEANLLEWLGTPSQTIRGGGSDVWYEYSSKGLGIGFTAGRARTVQTTTSSHRTADGISVGTPELKVRATWGQPTMSADFHELNGYDYCFANDLKVGVDTRSSTVRFIQISAERCYARRGGSR